MSNEDLLILVDENNHELGKMEKSKVHQLGLLHRAFSIFIFNQNGELILQQRNDEKYHSGGLWTNTCCSHPRFNEEINEAVKRRLLEEMGIQCNTEFQFSFIYQAEFENGLKEHEFDHVYFGISNELPIPNKDEAKNWKYIDMQLLKRDLIENPQHYTAWLKICIDKVIVHFEQYVSDNKLNIISHV